MNTSGQLNRSVAELVVQKLDLNAITAADAKKFLYTHYGLKVTGRSREDVANNILLHLKKQVSATPPRHPSPQLDLFSGMEN